MHDPPSDDSSQEQNIENSQIRESQIHMAQTEGSVNQATATGSSTVHQTNISINLAPAHTDQESKSLLSNISSPLNKQLKNKPQYRLRKLFSFAATSLASTSLVMLMRFLGILQPLELGAFDHLMRFRLMPFLPKENIDSRILVVEITEEDTRRYGYPIEDNTLAQLLEKLEQAKPRVVGIDLHRHQPRGHGREGLINSFRKNQNFFTVCSYSSSDKNYGPPPEFLESQMTMQLGFSDVIEDVDGVTRLNLLSYAPSLATAASTCSTPYSLSFLLGFNFLYKEGIYPIETNKDEEWQFGNVVFNKLTNRFGGYQNLGLRTQILINYRSSPPGQKTTLIDVLEGTIDSELIRDRIVLIGVTNPSARENFKTPYGMMSGVWINAYMTSQILSAVLDKRPLIWVLPQWRDFQSGDFLWVLVWSSLGGLLICTQPLRQRTVLMSTTVGSVLWCVCFLLLLKGGWVPFIPSFASIFLTVIATKKSGTLFIKK